MYRIGPIGRKSSIHSRRKCIIGLVLATLCLLCFGGIFLMPDDFGGDRILYAYKQFQEVGPNIFIPAPPFSRRPPIDSDPHLLGDRERLQAKIQSELDTLLNRPDMEVERTLDEPVRATMTTMRRTSAKVGHRPVDAVVAADADVAAGAAARRPPFKTPVISSAATDYSMAGGELGRGEEDSIQMPQGGNDDPDPAIKEKRNKIREMMEHAWKGYKDYAWGRNELKPRSKLPHFGSVFGSHDLGATIVDGLDTIYLMGFDEEYKAGRDWIDKNLWLNDVDADMSVFETNIRFIGGLLTLYAFTGDPMYRDRAQHIADKLVPAFKTKTGIPNALVNPKTGANKNYGWASGGNSILSEFGTLHLEFAYLSDVTGNPLYRFLVERIRNVIRGMEKPKGLYPNYLNPNNGHWGQMHMSFGALGDSFYEYLLKAWLQSGQEDKEARDMFDEAMASVMQHMVKKSKLSGLTYISEMKFGRHENRTDHLSCFAGGLFALAAVTHQNQYTDQYMKLGVELTHTCHESYDRTATKLGPEAFHFTDAVEAQALRPHEKYYILRPETIESYFVLWRITHDQKYRDWGWEAVEALEKHCRTANGYSGIRDVYNADSQKDDVQQSFFLAETLKYLYLLFSDDSLLPLDEWVFNTEAHPLPIKGANIFYRAATTAPSDPQPLPVNNSL